MLNPECDSILRELINEFFDKPLINNIYRGQYVESMISLALKRSTYKPWSLSYDWSAWDLESEGGVRIQVKQSVARQPWNDYSDNLKSKKPYFDIEPHKRYYESDGTTLRELDEPLRVSDIYIFAWHPESNPHIADHRRADQWSFRVALERHLPPGQKTIGLNPLGKCATEVSYDGLAKTIDELVSDLPEPYLKRNVI